MTINDLIQPESKQRLDLRDVSLVCIETRYPELALYAINRCIDLGDFGECILLTSSAVDLPGYIKQIRIPPITSIEQYSSFVICHLYKYFSNNHVLLIQWDGFAVNRDCWQDGFLDWDYIGAPWPHLDNVVGNGGFSLRSMKLCATVATIAAESTTLHPEDYVICVDLRGRLESEYGLQFAPRDIASQFSFEGSPPALPVFGFHGGRALGFSLSDTELSDFIKLCEKDLLKSWAFRGLVRSLIIQGRRLSALRLIKKIIFLSPRHFLIGIQLLLGILLPRKS